MSARGKLEYVILLHFEADENGGMDRFLEGAPSSTLACRALSSILNLGGWNYSGRVEGHTEGEVVDLGKHKLRWLETPHVHHWDSMMLHWTPSDTSPDPSKAPTHKPTATPKHSRWLYATESCPT